MKCKTFTFQVVIEVDPHVSERTVREFLFDALGTHKNLMVQDPVVYGTHNPMSDSEVRSITNVARMKEKSNGKT